MFGGQQTGGHADALRLAVPLQQGRAERLLCLVDARGRHRRRTVDDRLQRAQVEPVETTVIEERVQHGGDREHIVDAMGLHSGKPLLGVETRLQNDGAATQQRGKDREDSGVGDRSCDEGPRVQRQSPGGGKRKHLLNHRAMGDHGGLGPSGGAPGVLQPGDVFFLGVTAGERLRFNLGA